MSGRGFNSFPEYFERLRLPVRWWVGCPRERIETVGISIAVGKVLGASTLPFYSQPESQLFSFLHSGFTTVVRVSEWHLELSAGPSQGKNEDDHSMKRPPLGLFAGAQEFIQAQVRNTFISASESRWESLFSSDSSRPVLFCMPVVSLN